MIYNAAQVVDAISILLPYWPVQIATGFRNKLLLHYISDVPPYSFIILKERPHNKLSRRAFYC